MIEVLNKQVEQQKFYTCSCEDCCSELRFTLDDTFIGVLGARFLTCPVCGCEILTDIDGLDLTPDNIEFPVHFYQWGDNAVNIDVKEIQQWVREGLYEFRVGKAEDFWYRGSGNTFVIILEMKDEYHVYVMQNYWSCSIDKECCV